MRPDPWSDLILAANFLFLSGAGPALAWAVFQLRWPRSELRRRRRLSEMSAASRAVADWRESSQARNRGRARRRMRSGAIGAGRAARFMPLDPESRDIPADASNLSRVRTAPINDPVPALQGR
jgi:hypothetical protein